MAEVDLSSNPLSNPAWAVARSKRLMKVIMGKALINKELDVIWCLGTGHESDHSHRDKQWPTRYLSSLTVGLNYMCVNLSCCKHLGVLCPCTQKVVIRFGRTFYHHSKQAE